MVTADVELVMERIRSLFDGGSGDIAHQHQQQQPAVDRTALSNLMDESMLTEHALAACSQRIVLMVLFRWVMGLRINLDMGDVLVECRTPYRVFSMNESTSSIDGHDRKVAGKGDITPVLAEFVMASRSDSPPRTMAAYGELPRVLRSALTHANKSALIERISGSRNGGAHEVVTRNGSGNVYLRPFNTTLSKWRDVITMNTELRGLIRLGHVALVESLNLSVVHLNGEGQQQQQQQQRSNRLSRDELMSMMTVRVAQLVHDL
jgi:hypothetical protein